MCCLLYLSCNPTSALQFEQTRSPEPCVENTGPDENQPGRCIFENTRDTSSMMILTDLCKLQIRMRVIGAWGKPTSHSRFVPSCSVAGFLMAVSPEKTQA